MPQDYDHTVVVGGDIAGLLAARVLADHATRVSLLDRDRSRPLAGRARVPPGRLPGAPPSAALFRPRVAVAIIRTAARRAVPGAFPAVPLDAAS